jgi:hypothetical protein
MTRPRSTTRKRLFAVLVVLVVVALGVAGPVEAQPAESGPALLARAQGALDALRYEEAAALLDRAWRAGGNRPDELALLFRLSGAVAVTLGRDQEADLAFRRLLALAPDAALPDGTSPKIAARLQSARAALAGRSLRADAIERESGAGEPIVAIDVDSDPAGMVAAIRARYRDRGVEVVREARSPVPLEVGVGRGASRVDVTVLDEHGNVLVEQTLILREPAPDRPPPPSRPGPALASAPAPDAAPPLYARGLPWAAAAAGFGAVGLFFGLRSEADQDELDELNRSSADHDFRDALAVEDRLHRDSAIANVAFAAAGIAAVASVFFWIREARADGREARRNNPTRSPAILTFHF